MEECAICFEEIETPLPCGHYVHDRCIVKWRRGLGASKPKHCPLCLKGLPLGKVEIAEDDARRFRQGMSDVSGLFVLAAIVILFVNLVFLNMTMAVTLTVFIMLIAASLFIIFHFPIMGSVGLLAFLAVTLCSSFTSLQSAAFGVLGMLPFLYFCYIGRWEYTRAITITLGVCMTIHYPALLPAILLLIALMP
jgi:hypothetical protein